MKNMGADMTPEIANWLLGEHHKWRLRVALVPHRCKFSKKLIMPFTRAYSRINADGPNNPTLEIEWATQVDYLLYKLKGTI